MNNHICRKELRDTKREIDQEKFCPYCLFHRIPTGPRLSQINFCGCTSVRRGGIRAMFTNVFLIAHHLGSGVKRNFWLMPCLHAQSDILHIKYAEKTDD